MAVKQADAKPMQSLVEQIKAKAEAGDRLRRRSRPKTETEPETKTDEPAVPEVAPEAEPTDEAEQSEPEEPTDNNPGGGYEMDPKDIAKMQIKRTSWSSSCRQRYCRKLLGHTKGIRRFC